MSNPYQPFFDKLDATIVALDGIEKESITNPGDIRAAGRDASELLKRAGFVLGNLINAQSQVYPMLFLPAENPEPDTEGTEGTSLDRPEDADSEVHSTT